MKKFFIGLLATILINSRIKKTKSFIEKSPFPAIPVDNPMIVKIGEENKLLRFNVGDKLHVEGPCNDSIGYFFNFRQNWYLTNDEKDYNERIYYVVKNKDNTGKFRKNKHNGL